MTNRGGDNGGRGYVVRLPGGRAQATNTGGGRGERSSSNYINRVSGGTPPSSWAENNASGGSDVRLSRGRGQASNVFMDGQPAYIDSRIADDSDKALVASFTYSDSLPLRPDFGTDGREIKLRTNFFPVQVPQDTKLYAYDVIVGPMDMIPCHVKRRIYHLAERTTEWVQAGMSLPGRVVHDYNGRLISAYLLPQPLVIRVPYYIEGKSGPPQEGGMTYTLRIIFVQQIGTRQLASYLAGQMRYRGHDILPIVSSLNLILTSLPKKMDIVLRRNQYFTRETAEPFRLGGGIEAWKGLNTSVRLVYKQLMVNAYVCTRSFYTPGNLALAMMAFQDASMGARMDYFCRGVRIQVTRLGYRKTIKGFASHSARTCSFDSEYGWVTTEDYFRQKYNIRLQYPDLRLVSVSARENANYLPAEVCDILSGQPFFRRLSEQQAATISTVACRTPKVNGEMTVNQVRHHLGLDVIRPELQTLGITISPDMAVVPGRILSKPAITYASSNTPTIGGRASWNLIGLKFAVGARLDNWTVLVIKDGASRGEFAGASDGELREVLSSFRYMCNTSGMHIAANPTYAIVQLPPKKQPIDPLRREAILTIRDTLLNVKPKPSLVLVMLANEDKAIYEGIKHLCDVRLDVATVCVRSSKIRQRKPHYLANVVLKVNAKLGGVNHRLDSKYSEWLNKVPTMVVGVDVTHPSPGSSIECPSVAAVVASVDSDFAQYPAILDVQPPRVEMITSLKNMMVDRLMLFQKKNNGRLPERILIYRNGISKNHFYHLREVEQPLIFEAFRTFDSYRPMFTIVVCSKNRHVHLYPTEQDNAASDGNPLPGTVVDRGITAIYDFDFFLQSHGNIGAQGTTHPTHYYVVHDEIGFSADAIQGVTHALSYTFARATQAVSLVCPAYYADLACKRGRCYLRKLFHGYVDEGGTTASGSQTEGGSWSEVQRLWGWGVAGAGLKDTMFYL